MTFCKWIKFQTRIAACLYCFVAIGLANAQSASISRVSDQKKSNLSTNAEPVIKDKKLIREECNGLTREGVTALCKNDFPLAISKFEHAIRLNPNAQMARTNLAIAYNNYGLVTKDNAEALKYFRQSYALNPNNENVRKNIERVSALVESDKKSSAAHH